jgi:short-subunit dehydrogenase
MTDSNRTHRKLTALVTGASNGIGRELAKTLARNGHDVVLVARDAQKLDQLANDLKTEFGITTKVMPKDLSISTSAQEIFDELQKEGIRINILVNNAGFDVYGNFRETDLVKELQMIQVNLTTLTQLTKLFLKDMAEQGYGRILNLGSTGSFVPSPLNAVYSATKAYVLSFSEAIAEELHGTGVTVTVMCPGATKTEFHKRAKMESVRLLTFGVMDAKTVAEAGYRAMMAGKGSLVPGLYNKVQVLSARFVPRSFSAKTAKMMLR